MITAVEQRDSVRRRFALLAPLERNATIMLAKGLTHADIAIEFKATEEQVYEAAARARTIMEGRPVNCQ